jgi:argonaute-like protein implicated in RNA metabolism and viral defense
MLGKTGNMPFILADPLPYADMVVGIDIARKKKERQQGSMNALAVTRIYMNNGYLLKYTINDYQIEGETIPKHVLIRLFPADEFRGKRVVIHRDGYFRGEEKQVLQNWAKEIGAVFYLVEIIKSDNPRIYRMLKGNIQRPSKGDFFKLNDYEAFLVSSLPPSKEDTPHPLHIRTDGSISIEDAIHSVLSLTLLNYGSLRPPRLPVTTHYSDRMSHMLLKGIRPKNLEGSNPFWL